MQLSNGAGEEAYAAAVANIEEIVKSKVSPRNKYAFALGMGVLALFVSVAEMLASLLVRNIEFYGVEIPAVWLGFGVIIILYLIFKRRSYRRHDFVVLGVLFLSWFAVLYQLLAVFLFNYTPGSFNELDFIFPCIFDYRVHRGWMEDGVYSETYYFYSVFLGIHADLTIWKLPRSFVSFFFAEWPHDLSIRGEKLPESTEKVCYPSGKLYLQAGDVYIQVRDIHL